MGCSRCSIVVVLFAFAGCGKPSAPPSSPPLPTDHDGTTDTSLVAVEEAATGPMRPRIERHPSNPTRLHVRFDPATFHHAREHGVETLAGGIETQVATNVETGEAAGLRLAELRPDSLLTALDLRVGDLLVSQDGKPITSRADFERFIQTLKRGISTELTFVRKGKRFRMSIDPRDPQIRRR